MKSPWTSSLVLILLILTAPLSSALAQSDENFNDGGIEQFDEIQDVETVNNEQTSSEDPLNELTDLVNGIEKTTTDSEEDPDSEISKENDFFGNDTSGEENPNDQFENENGPTHLLKMDYEARVLVTDLKKQESYLEIVYTVKLEQEIELSKNKSQVIGKAEVLTDVIGTLVSNELATCNLTVDLSNFDMEIKAKHKTTPETDEEDATSQLALKVKASPESMMETWRSNCTASDGSIMNTEGDKEKYLFITLEAIEPNMNNISIDDFDPYGTTITDLIMDDLIIEDGYEEFLLQATGTIVLEPYGE